MTFAAMLALAAGGAHAISAHATLDWSALQMNLVDVAPDDGIDASFSMQYAYTVASNCLSPGSCSLVADPSDWTTAFGATVDAGAAGGRVAVDAGTASVGVSGRADAGEPYLKVTRGAWLTFSGASLLTVTVPFTLSVDAAGQDALSGSFAMVALGFDGLPSQQYISSPWDGTTTVSGLLTATVSNADGDARGVWGFSYASLQYAPSFPPVAAPVPEPASVAMMLAGVALVAGVARRRPKR